MLFTDSFSLDATIYFNLLRAVDYEKSLDRIENISEIAFSWQGSRSSQL